MVNDRILVVEDDKNILKLIRYNLEKSGFDCTTTITAEEALSILGDESISLVILDIMLPKMDGLEACRLIKNNKQLAHIPVIMLTAKGEEIDKVVGFELGADDYMVKPFSPRELILRIKAILKRHSPRESSASILSIKGIRLDPFKHEVTVGKKKIALAYLEFKLLETLMQRKGRVQTRQRLLDDVWGISADVTTRTVDTHIKRLRQKLGSAGRLIQTVRAVGYKINDEE